jgi:hypothetical protein
MMLSEGVHLIKLESAISSSILKENHIGNCESSIIGGRRTLRIAIFAIFVLLFLISSDGVFGGTNVKGEISIRSIFSSFKGKSFGMLTITGSQPNLRANDKIISLQSEQMREGNFL